jgi:hypothetical protein
MTEGSSAPPAASPPLRSGSGPAPVGAPAEPGAQPRGFRWALAALLAATLGLRLWFLSGDLDATRFYDERFGFRNVSALLEPGGGARLQAFYPSLSFVPQAAVLAVSDGLHRLTGLRSLAIHDPARPDGWSATAYLLVRSLSALFGTLSVGLLFALGARLWSPAAGLLAALLFSATPRHVQSSSHFKPDVLVALLVLLAFWWSLDAAESGRRRRFWLAGAGLGLSVAAKYTGIAALFPLVVAALAGHWRDRRRWRYLAEAGAASLLTFALLNPHLAVIVRFVGRLWRIGASKGPGAGVTFGSAAAEQLDFLLDHHGPALLTVAAIGAVGIGVESWRRRGTGAALGGAMALALVGCYSLLWVALRFFRGQNHLPVAAMTSLFAAWALWQAGRRVAARLGPAAAWGLGLVLAAAVTVPTAAWSYRGRVPSTAVVAVRAAREELPQPLRLRWVLLERGAGDSSGAGAAPGLALRRVESVLAAPPIADAEVFPAGRLDAAAGARYRQRLADPAVRTWRIEPRPFRSRGAPLLLLVRPWEAVSELAPAPLIPVRGRRLRLRFEPPLAADEWVSLELRLPTRDRAAAARDLRVEGLPLPVAVLGVNRRGTAVATARFRPRDPARVELTLPPAPQAPRSAVRARVARWRPGGQAIAAPP